MAGGIIGNLMFAVGFKVKSNDLKEADGRIGALKASVIGLGAAGIAGFAALGVAAVSAASNFESAMSSVKMTTGQTSEQMAETREIAKNLYNQNFGEDWNDLGNSISAVSKATGLTGDALESASREAMLYAKTFDGDVGESIASVSTAMNNFGVTSTEAFNLLTQGQNAGLDVQGDMIDTVNEYSQAFASMGFSMEDTFAYLDNGLKAGARNTDLLGDAMNEFSILSIEAGGTAADSFKMLGLDSDKMMQTFSKGGPEAKKAFGDIVSMISDVEDPVQQNIIGVGLFGTMFEELGVKAFSALDDVNNGFDMSKDSAGNLINSFVSVGDAMQYLKRHIETGILIPIGEKLMPYLNQFGAWISGHQGEIAAFGAVIGDGIGRGIELVAAGIQAAIPYLVRFGAAAGQAFSAAAAWARDFWTDIEPVVIGVGTQLVGAIKTLWPEIQRIATQAYAVGRSFVQWEGFIPLVVGITGAILTYKSAAIATTIATKAWTVATNLQTIATRTAAVAMRLLSVAMRLNPIGIFISLLIGLGAAFVTAYQRSETFRNIVNGIWASIKAGWAATMNFFTTTIPAVFTSIVNWVTTGWNSVKTSTASAWASITGSVRGAWNSMVGAVSAAVAAILNWVISTWNGIVSSISTAMATVQSVMTNAWEGVKGAVAGVGSYIGSTLSGAWEGVKTTFSSAVNWIIAKFNGMIGRLNSISISNPFTGEQIAGVNIPMIPTIDGSHKTGLDYVPYDGYVAELHKGEEVLTADEARQRRAQPAAARSAYGSSAAPVFNINIEVSGGSGSPQEIAAEVARQLQAVIESAGRRLNVQGGTANG